MIRFLLLPLLLLVPPQEDGKRKIAYMQDGGIHVMDEDGTNRKEIARGYFYHRTKSPWSPDGKTLIVSRGPFPVPGPVPG